MQGDLTPGRTMVTNNKANNNSTYNVLTGCQRLSVLPFGSISGLSPVYGWNLGSQGLTLKTPTATERLLGFEPGAPGPAVVWSKALYGAEQRPESHFLLCLLELCGLRQVS